MKITRMLSIVAALFTISAHGQGFVNLNFEAAQNLPGNPGNGASVSVADALPGWSAYVAGNALLTIYYLSNNFPGAVTSVELEGGSLALGGNNFSVGLYSNGSITQTGLVPGTAESLQFEATHVLNLEVSLGGQSLQYSEISQGPDYDVYGANIPTDLEGQMESLTFLIQGPAQTLLDNIEFSPVSVPEPPAYPLICLGAVVFSLWRCRKVQNTAFEVSSSGIAGG